MTTENASGSLPTVADTVKEYRVSVEVDVQLSLMGSVDVYAVDEEEATEKVQAKIDAEELDDSIEMEDENSGITVPYGHLKYSHDLAFQISGSEMINDEVDPVEVLHAEVDELREGISWTPETLAKQKAFLISLLSEGNDQQAAGSVL